MFNDYKKKHPSYDAFISENNIGMKEVHNAITSALALYNEFSKDCWRAYKDGKCDTSLLDRKYVKRLNENTMHALASFNYQVASPSNGYAICREAHTHIGEYQVHVHGFMKLGERSKNDLDDDIEMLHSNQDNELRTDLFDFNSCLHVGYYFEKDGFKYSLNPYEASHTHFSFDISGVLLRMLTQGKLKNDTRLIYDAMVNVLFNKMITWELTKFSMFKIILDNMTFKMTENVRHGIAHIDLLKFLSIYKVFYNSINGIQVGTGLSIKEILDNIELKITGMNFDNGIMSYMNSIYDKLNNNLFDEKRQIDKDIDHYFDLVRFTLRESYIIKPNGNIATNNIIDNNGMVMPLTHDNISCESVREINDTLDFLKCSDLNEYYDRYNNQKDQTFIAGIESNTDPINSMEAFMSLDYETFVSKSRSYALMKLSSKHKKLFLEYENEILKLKSDSMNCRTPEVQRSLIDKSTSISKRINIDINNNHDEFFDGLLLLLDSYRVRLTNDLASIDFKKLRNSMLYGNLKTKTNFDY